MPIYKGSNEVTSGNLRKGSTNIENGYKQTDQFYVNTNAITINFVDAISGATMDTTQFSSTGAPGSSFASFSRTITTDSGRVFQGTVSVAESGDTGGNVTASISGQGTTTATLNVSGTHPTTGVTVTLTVNGATQLDPPNLIVSINSGWHTTVSTEDGSNLGSVTLTASGNNCTGGSTNTVTHNFGNVSSGTYYGFNGCQTPACQVTATFTVSASKAGYDSGVGSHSEVGPYPNFAPTYDFSTAPTCNCSMYTNTYCPTTLTPNANCIGNPTHGTTNCAGTTYPASVGTAGTMIDATYYEIIGWTGTQVGSSSTYTIGTGGLSCSGICFYFCSNGPDGTGTGPYAGC